MRWMTLAFLLFTLVNAPLVHAATTSCECEAATCGPCEVEHGVSFYSAKCGEDDSRVKSCKKPRCEAVENQKQCFADLEAGSKPVVAAVEPANRAPASVTRAEAGAVMKTQGSSLVWRPDGSSQAAAAGVKVFVGDDVEAKANSKVLIELVDHSQLTVIANSRVSVERAESDPKTARRQILLNLLQGRIRSRVEKKLDGESAYVVRTKTAVAGVRGTDFITSFDPGAKEWTTQVQTIEGRVHLESAAPNEDKSVEVSAGTSASFIIAAPADDTDETQVFENVHKGYVTPILRLKEDDLHKIDEATRFREPPRAVATADTPAGDAICQAPSGRFNQCSFTCETTVKGVKRCASCVRRICRANGAWADPTRLPAADSSRCETGAAAVHDCGSYW